jgi:hypothetical protein
VLSATSLVVASIALTDSGEQQATVAVQRSSAEPPTQEPASGAPSPSLSSTETVRPAGVYSRAYQDERLRAESPGCYESSDMISIDFDIPQIDADNSVDAYYSGCNPGTIRSELRQAEVSGPDTTPEECLERIRTQPAHSPIPAAKDLTLCFQTDGSQAESEARTQKVVFMTITDVSSRNDRGILSFTLTAWDVP